MRSLFKFAIMSFAAGFVAFGVIVICMLGEHDYNDWKYLSGWFACMAFYETGKAFDYFTKSH